MTKTKQLPSGDPRELGFVPERLGRIGRTMDAAVAARAIPGTVTVVASEGPGRAYARYGQTRPRPSRKTVDRQPVPHVFADQTDHGGGADDAVRRGLVPARRAGVEMDTGVRESESDRVSAGERTGPWRTHARRPRSGAPRDHDLRSVDDDLRRCGEFAHTLGALADAARRMGGHRLRSRRYPLQRSDQRLRRSRARARDRLRCIRILATRGSTAPTSTC